MQGERIMNFAKLLLPALAAAFVFAGAASADAAVVHKRVVQRTWVSHNNGHRVVHRTTRITTTRVVRRPVGRFITRDRAYVFFRARPGIRYVGVPYIYGNYYVRRCYDPVSGRLAFCEIDPYTGAWL